MEKFLGGTSVDKQVHIELDPTHPQRPNWGTAELLARDGRNMAVLLKNAWGKGIGFGPSLPMKLSLNTSFLQSWYALPPKKQYSVDWRPLVTNLGYAAAEPSVQHARVRATIESN